MTRCIAIKSLFLLFLLTAYLCKAQSEKELPLVDQFDVVTMDWLEKTDYMKTYAGINEYCRNPNFRTSVDRVLTSLHTYDSLILHTLDDPYTYLGLNGKEERKTRSDISSFEEHYQLKDFVEHMRKSCLFRNEIEANADDLRNGVSYESYDAKVLVLVTETSRYLKNIDKLVLKIDDHLHSLDLNSY